MRDHPNHIQPIMGGLWGVKLNKSRHFFEGLLKDALLAREHSLASRNERNHDQVILERYFWYEIKKL